MTLGRKMACQIGAMVAGLLLLGGAALWGLDSQRQDYGSALAGYGRLRQLFEVGAHLQTARTLLALDPSQRELAFDEVEVASQRLTLLGGEADSSFEGLAEIRRPIKQALAGLAEQGDSHAASTREAVNRALARISQTAAQLRRGVEERQRAAQAKRQATMALLGLTATTVVLAAVALGIWQYRGVMGPLHRLGQRVRQLAARQFAQPPSPVARPDDEFGQLTYEFDRMAQELDRTYQDLESKVALKSRELIRSERLASVGYLAAGVAHEINNPLSIISGYAEYTLTELEQGPPDPDQLRSSLRIVCDEAFRCKGITQRLLALAHPGDGKRQNVDLADVARQVANLVGGLTPLKNRTLAVQASHDQKYGVLASEAEMKQVVMNLVVNALEAAGEQGMVNVSLAADGRDVVLTVDDNGRGMSRGTLERVFEPFFTDKRGAQQPGTGLGLSISHAIVSDHGGSLSAHSEGLGKGSRFTVRLPALAPEQA